MARATSSERSTEIDAIVDSARRLGIEIDEKATAEWLAAIAQPPGNSDVVLDTDAGTFGHRVSMLDFSPTDLERFRRIGKIVEITGPVGVAESALALSGSAAQSKIQSFPGDCDYFQRLNIIAATREDACAILAQLMRDKVLATEKGDTYQFLEAKLGSYEVNGTRAGEQVRKGSPVTWKFADIEAGHIELIGPDAAAVVVTWAEAARDPGWCKLDWVVTDPARTQLSNASNVIDVTWEAPDGTIVSLDGYLDAFFQEVYLDSGAVPVFAKVAKFVTEDALDEYVDRIEEEVHKYLTDHLNYGKAAKRMYNIFRLSGRHLDAAFVRELFDEPSTVLYQVWSLISTLENATQPGSSIPIETVRSQADALVVEVVKALDGDAETEIVTALLELRETLEGQKSGEARTAQVEAVQSKLVNLINTFYRDKLTSQPTIKQYIDDIQAG